MSISNAHDDLVNPEMFSRVNVDRASQVIVDQIKLLVRDGLLSPGDRLPSERELCQRFGVSRVTVREALRMLETTGLVSIRVGARGGAFLTTPSAEQLGAGLADLISLAPFTAMDVTEARMIVELGILPLVVARATDGDIEALETLVAEGRRALSKSAYTVEMSATFHIRVAACTHNAAIEMLIQSFHGPLLMSLQEAHEAAPIMGRVGTDEHEQLVHAIRDRNLKAAQKVMQTHLGHTSHQLKEIKSAESSTGG